MLREISKHGEIKTDPSNNEVKYTIQESINVDDIEGHVIRIFKTETNHKKSKKFKKSY